MKRQSLTGGRNCGLKKKKKTPHRKDRKKLVKHAGQRNREKTQEPQPNKRDSSMRGRRREKPGRGPGLGKKKSMKGEDRWLKPTG